ncbi:endo alpha-1,4 polygalactosaminidase [Paraburkholderia phosphatilytica]|uniref:endo alpha-1,4 polygalactosaminidase n=1 Tax=Paraburkholderia phosphatilytica TaxID=2282883 RepID=UPI000E477E28
MNGSWTRDAFPLGLLCAALAIVLVSLLWVQRAAAARADTQGGVASHAIGRVAFYYGEHVPVDALHGFDTVVVEADSGFDPRAHAASGTHWFAYVSVGEVSPDRDYRRDMPDEWLIGTNTTWASTVIDQAAPGWPAFFAEHVIGPLWARGYRGFFLDTLDSYQLAARTDAARARQQAGLIEVIRTAKARYPGIRFIFNRGFEILPQVHDAVDAVAFESLFGEWDQANQRYDEVSKNDREWLLAQAETIRDRYHLPVISIDYCEPGDDAAARSIVERISAIGITPYVTDGALRSVGLGPEFAAQR